MLQFLTVSGTMDLGKIGEDLLAEADWTAASIMLKMENLMLGSPACPTGEIATWLIMSKLAPKNETSFLIEFFRVMEITYCRKDVAKNLALMMQQ